jgi:hypothetical protein
MDPNTWAGPAFWVAVYGATLSTFLAIQQLRERRRDVRVLLTLGSIALVRDHPPLGAMRDARPGNPPADQLILTASNLGLRTVTLGALGFEVAQTADSSWLRRIANPALGAVGYLQQGRRDLSLTTPARSVEFPHPLPQGQSCHAWVPASDFARDLKQAGFTGKVELVSYYADQLGKKYRSRPLQFDADAWAAQVTA